MDDKQTKAAITELVGGMIDAPLWFQDNGEPSLMGFKIRLQDGETRLVRFFGMYHVEIEPGAFDSPGC